MSNQHLEARYQSLIGLAEQSYNRTWLWMKMSVALGVSSIGLGYYVNEKFYPLVNTLEEITRGPWENLDPITQAGLTASLGVIGLGVVTTACIAAAGINAYRHVRANREADRLRISMMNKSKRPPTLGS